MWSQDMCKGGIFKVCKSEKKTQTFSHQQVWIFSFLGFEISDSDDSASTPNIMYYNLKDFWGAEY